MIKFEILHSAMYDFIHEAIFNEEYGDRSECCSRYELEKDANANGGVNGELNHDHGKKEKEILA